MKVLVINTYGGSLLLGAKLAKAEVIATMEDCGFGSDLQALNFPRVPQYKTSADWPDKFSTPWRGIDVIAHPPCASFSVQNSKSLTRRGVDTDGFACHRAVMDYALGRAARTLTIESVVPAYEIAHEEYERTAERYGYKVSYIMLNSAVFGTPQWRPRVWIVFHKAKTFKVNYKPRWTTVADILDKRGETAQWPNKFAIDVFTALKQRVTAEWVGKNIYKEARRLDDCSLEAFRRRYNLGVPFESNAPYVLDPTGFAPTLVLTSSWLTIDGRKPRLLTVEEYCAIMGFPRDYKWGAQAKKFRMYLSKGVCPPVAAWILKMVDNNASGWTGPSTHEERDFGGVIDLRPKKQEALARARGEDWPPPSAPKATRLRSSGVVRTKRDPSEPRGHRYRIVDESKCVAPQSPQAKFILAALRKTKQRGLTRSELVALAIADPKGFPTNQPHDHAIGFFLSKFKSAKGLEFAE